MRLPLVLQFASERVQCPCQCLYPSPHILNLVLVLPQFPRSLRTLLGLSLLTAPPVFLKLLVRLLFFFLETLLDLFYLRLEIRVLAGLVRSLLVLGNDGVSLGETHCTSFTVLSS
jgi:hypothetical protein